MTSKRHELDGKLLNEAIWNTMKSRGDGVLLEDIASTLRSDYGFNNSRQLEKTISGKMDLDYVNSEFVFIKPSFVISRSSYNNSYKDLIPDRVRNVNVSRTQVSDLFKIVFDS